MISGCRVDYNIADYTSFHIESCPKNLCILIMGGNSGIVVCTFVEKHLLVNADWNAKRKYCALASAQKNNKKQTIFITARGANLEPRYLSSPVKINR